MAPALSITPKPLGYRPNSFSQLRCANLATYRDCVSGEVSVISSAGPLASRDSYLQRGLNAMRHIGHLIFLNWSTLTTGAVGDAVRFATEIERAGGGEPLYRLSVRFN